MTQQQQSQHLSQVNTEKKTRIGQLLQQAGLVFADQVELALQNQAIPIYNDLKLGEILALRGWVPQQTSDFFASRWHKLVRAAQTSQHKIKIEVYLYEANLLTREQILVLLKEQQKQSENIGNLAVNHGYLKQQTLDFFIENLCTKPRTKSNVEICIERAENYYRSQYWQCATLALRKALNLEPQNHQSHAWLAKIYLDRQQLCLAQVHLQQAIDVNPNDPFVKKVRQQFSNVSQQLSAKRNEQYSNQMFLQAG